MSTRLSQPQSRQSPTNVSPRSTFPPSKVSPTAAARIAAMHAQSVESIAEESDDESAQQGQGQDALNNLLESRLRLLQRHRMTGSQELEAPIMPSTRTETRSNVRRRLTYLLRDELAPELSPVQNAVKLLQQLKDRLALEKTDEAAIDYAISVLYRDRDYIHVPEVLQIDQDNNTHQWLQRTFTRAVHPVAAMLKDELEDIRLGPGRARTLTKSHWVQLPYTATAEQAQAIAEVLAKVDNWEFDVLELRAVTTQRELQTLGWHLLRNVYNLITGDEPVWCRWLQWAESAYVNTDYHNATHAADVLQTVHFFLCAGARPLFTDTQLLALLLSAIVHDLGHDGLNNAFHKGSMSERAVLHNDRSIQESFHIATAFSHTLSNPAINIFALLDKSVLRELRSLMINMVLATDMSFHFEHLARFKKLVDAHGTDYEAYPEEELPHILCVLLHGADVSNPAKPVALAKHWAGLVLKEFFTQGAQEKLLGLPVSPNCDPVTTVSEQVQVGFIKYIVLPFFTSIAAFLPQVGVQCLPQLHSNLAFWQRADAEKKADISKNQASQKESEDKAKSEDKSSSTETTDKAKDGKGQFSKVTTEPVAAKVGESTTEKVVGKAPQKLIRRKSKKGQ